MYGWCDKCKAVAIEGLCSKHGKVKPISHINAIDVHPLTKLEKRFLNKRLKGLKLGKGIFLIYGDRIYRRKIVFLNKPLVEIKLKKDGIHLETFAKGKVEGMEIDSLCSTNADRINRLSSIAETFSQWELESNGNAIISFSGGKDSTVLAHLLKKFNLKNVFIDTTIEFPETYEFIKKLQKLGWKIDIVKAKVDFFKLCKSNGFPEYKNRWCCKTQKFAPFIAYLKENFGDKRVTVFSGIRRWESLARLEQPLKKQHKYITTQDTVQPILDWLSMDTWIYLWTNKLPINKLYDYFDRGGCWTCPFGLRYRLFMLKYSHPKFYNRLQKIRNSN